MNRKAILMILDGWGLGKDPKVSAIAHSKTPFMDEVMKKYPMSTLEASGLAVGLPEGQMGNSEVGHMNLGAGRVVYQDLVRVNEAIKSRELHQNPVLNQALDIAIEQHKPVHFIGLVSDGGVHAHIQHIQALCQLCKEKGVAQFFVHAFTDGRDTDPKSGLGFIKQLKETLAETGGRLATVIGRYYAMDRDKRWERIKLAYDAMIHGVGNHTTDVLSSIQESYNQGVTDEFIKPIIHVKHDDHPVATIQDGDVVICFNFRTDRGRQITQVFTQQDLPEFGMFKKSLHYVTLTNYDDSFQNVKVVFDKDNLTNTLGEHLSKLGKKQIRIAETEKYPHVTFFFSGGREEAFEGESRILCPSPKVATYDLKPEMSAEEIKDSIIPELKKGDVDFVCLNFANPDMVGHTGVFSAAVKACETVDRCAGEVVNAAMENGYATFIIADHGNSDIMINPDGSPNTAHTTNLVPCILVSKTYQGKLKNGKLGDMAPTILSYMNLDIPKEMAGNILIET